MAYFLEDALRELESIIRTKMPDMLMTIMSERPDGIILDTFAEYHWEEVAEKLGALPAILLIPDTDVDPDQSDAKWDHTVQIYIIARDEEKRNLTKKLLRYVEALSRLLRAPFNRTLNQTAISAKIVRVGYGATFVDRDQRFVRDINAELIIRLSRVGS